MSGFGFFIRHTTHNIVCTLLCYFQLIVYIYAIIYLLINCLHFIFVSLVFRWLVWLVQFSNSSTLWIIIYAKMQTTEQNEK